MVSEDEKYVVCGPKPIVPEWQGSLGSFLYEYLWEANGENIAMVDVYTNDTLTYGHLLKQTCALAEILRSQGYGRNSVFSVCSENNLQFFVPVLASIFIGAGVAPYNHAYTLPELRHGLNLSKPKIIFCSEQVVKKFLDMRKEMSFIEKVIVIDSKVNIPGVENLDNIIQSRINEKNLVQDFQPFEDTPEDLLACILSSSGTTGLPKGVSISHRNVLTIINMSRDPRYCRTGEGDTIIGLLPFFHIYGLVVTLVSLVTRVKTAIMKAFNDDLYLKTIQDYKVTSLAITPPLAVFFSKSPKVSQYDLSSVKVVTCGAAPLSKNTEESFKKKLNLSYIIQIYGLTETTTTITALPKGIYKAGTISKLSPSIKCIIRDPETGKPLGPNLVGEICVKGPLVMMGYYNNKKATDEIFTSDGWLRTGDLGYYDEEEFFYVVDRMKELIKYKGFQVPPAEIESILLNHPKIRDAGVVGLPDDECGELPLAFVVKQEDVDLTETEVEDYVKRNISPQKRLRGGVRFVSEIPKNPSGKILRRELRKLLDQPKSKL